MREEFCSFSPFEGSQIIFEEYLKFGEFSWCSGLFKVLIWYLAEMAKRLMKARAVTISY